MIALPPIRLIRHFADAIASPGMMRPITSARMIDPMQSSNSAIQFRDREQPSLYLIEGGNTDKLMAKLAAARDRWAKVNGTLPGITLCYEVGHDAFWLARFLKARGIECLVIDPGSLQVNMRARVRKWPVPTKSKAYQRVGCHGQSGNELSRPRT